MADNSGGIGVMGVLVGAFIVIVVGAGILFATGTIGSGAVEGVVGICLARSPVT
jgi:hypothetical protein